MYSPNEFSERCCPRRVRSLYRSQQRFPSSALVITLKPGLTEEYRKTFTGCWVGYCFPMQAVCTVFRHRKPEQILTFIFCSQSAWEILDFCKVWIFLLLWAGHWFSVFTLDIIAASEIFRGELGVRQGKGKIYHLSLPRNKKPKLFEREDVALEQHITLSVFATAEL